MKKRILNGLRLNTMLLERNSPRYQITLVKMMKSRMQITLRTTMRLNLTKMKILVMGRLFDTLLRNSKMPGSLRPMRMYLKLGSLRI